VPTRHVDGVALGVVDHRPDERLRHEPLGQRVGDPRAMTTPCSRVAAAP
jgi:hypothetical protein